VVRDAAQGAAPHHEGLSLTMRVSDLILRSIAKRCVSKHKAIQAENALVRPQNRYPSGDSLVDFDMET